MPKRQHYLFVCINRRPDGHPKGSCATSDSERVLTLLKMELAKTGLAAATARACSCSCLDICHQGPVVGVQPDGFFYGRVHVEDVPEIVRALETGVRVERLVLADFDPKTE